MIKVMDAPRDSQILARTAMELDESTAQYLREVEQLPSLTREQECELSERLGKGDLEAKTLLIRGNRQRVVKIAMDYTDKGLPLFDLIKAGNDGLREVVEGFDPSKGLPLSAAADWHIKLHVKRALVVHSDDQ